MAERGATIMGAGDDDQSIYSFRRAHPAGIRRFLDDYPGAVSYPLLITHRCGRFVVDWANEIIAGDLDRPADRELLTPAETAPDGEVGCLKFDNEVDEAVGVALLIQELIENKGLEPNEILVLMRGDFRGHFSQPVKDALDGLGIAYSDPDRPKRVLEDAENREVFEVFRLLTNREDSLAWAGLFELGTGIGPSLRDYIYEKAKSESRQFGQAVLGAFHDEFPDAPAGSGARAQALVGEVLGWVDTVEPPASTPEGGWGSWIAEQANNAAFLDPGEDLIDLLVDLDEVMEPELTLGQFLGQALPLAKDRAANLSDGVRIMTMATSKGLTVRATIAIGLEEVVMPSSRADRSEEVRLLYVAMTRAKEFLYLTWARRRRGAGARAGGGDAQTLRRRSTLLDAGTIDSQDGKAFVEALG
jgi:DNA helicase-2/ATP-dependent DNA helicase PcrA